MSEKSLARESLTELVCLNSTGVVGPILFDRLIGKFGSPSGILGASRKELVEVDGIGPETANMILEELGREIS